MTDEEKIEMFDWLCENWRKHAVSNHAEGRVIWLLTDYSGWPKNKMDFAKALRRLIEEDKVTRMAGFNKWLGVYTDSATAKTTPQPLARR